MRKIHLLLFIFFIIFFGVQCNALEIKLGSLAPAGSLWDKSLRELAVQWQELSGGKVKLKIYHGGIAGDESAIIRKIRLRQLHAGALSGVGLNQIAQGPLAMSAPMLVRDDDELNYILEKTTPYFDKELEKKQFIVVMWTSAGWTHYFGRKPIVHPDDLRKQKLWIWDTGSKLIQVWKKAGFNPIPLSATDILTSLQSGMIDALLSTPLTTAASQWFAFCNNMCDLKFAPMIAGIVVSKSIWEKIPDDIKPDLLDSAKKMQKKISLETIKADEEAIAIMKQHGLVVNHVPEDVVAEWKELVEKYYNDVIDSDFGRDAYELVKSQLEEYRKND
ncbi:MAG: TRAP transporter substrate-binding protein DctP [Spirochaetales bacterium]|nr:TRAP transporter substrate-binding protein DctP [Spirochaetales bacterium]